MNCKQTFSGFYMSITFYDRNWTYFLKIFFLWNTNISFNDLHQQKKSHVFGYSQMYLSIYLLYASLFKLFERRKKLAMTWKNIFLSHFYMLFFLFVSHLEAKNFDNKLFLFLLSIIAVQYERLKAKVLFLKADNKTTESTLRYKCWNKW